MKKKNLIEFNYQKKKFNNIGFLKKMTIVFSYFIKFFSQVKFNSTFKNKIYMIYKSLDSRKVFTVKTIIYSEKLIDVLIQSKKSLIRWGDSETFFYLGENVSHQNFDISLKNKLDFILKTYNSNSRYLLALPLTPLLQKNIDLFLNGYFIFWYKTRFLLVKIFKSKNLIFYDAFSFRYESSLSNEKISKLWLGFDLILVSNNKNIYMDICNFNSNSSNFFVKINEFNAFDNYISTLNIIKRISERMNRENLRVLIAAGVTAKALVFDLSNYGLICYDLGNYFNHKFYEN